MLAFAPRSVRAAAFSALTGRAAARRRKGSTCPLRRPGSGGEDTIETSSGARCRQSINSNGAYLDLGLTGRATSGGATRRARSPPRVARDQDAARATPGIAMPALAQKPERIDCSRLYELEIARMQREIELLQMAAE